MEEKLKDLQAKLRQKEREIYSIQRIGQALSNTLRLEDLLNLIMREITELMNADRSTLYLLDEARGEIWSKIALKAEVKEIRQKIGVGISGMVALTGETINIPDAYQDERFDPSTDKRTGYRTRSILCIPVWEPVTTTDKRKMLGVIQVLNKKDGEFTEEDEEILKAIASQVAVAISNARLYQQLEKKYQEMDLLYEFEQLISREFDLQRIFSQMLGKILSLLEGELAVIVFPQKGQYSMLMLDRNGTEQLKPLVHLEGDLWQAIESPKPLDDPENRQIILQYLPVLANQDAALLKALRIQLVGEEQKPALLFFQGRPRGKEAMREDDTLLLELVAQKISRAIELHELREALLQKERLSAIGQMMSTIVHDLRSPINSIYGFMELLMDENISPEEKKEFAEIIRTEIQTITNMTREILDFAKGKTNILPRKSSVKQLFQRLEPQLEQLFRNTHITLKMENNARKLVYMDVEKMARVLYNIAKNAREAMGDSGEFTLRAYDGENEVIFELSDNGPGIPEEIRDRLFESFVTSGKKNGTGLGLAIVKKIVDEHHGSIEIETETGKGTTFYIRLPEYQAAHVVK